MNAIDSPPLPAPLVLPGSSARLTTRRTSAPGLELWGGIECTLNRVHDLYFNQLVWNGHVNRPADLDRFAALGIKALRYPVLWEMLAPDKGRPVNWTFADERLPRLRELGVRPIANLVHHGSGPRHASVGTPEFASGLARYARQVAERFPWIDAYTPVNEPLTTARFCGLYGVWYPHGEDHRIFVRILASECRATVLAMREIRKVNPVARLIQTDDLGYVYSTPAMSYEADYQNHRRWLAWDLLCGRVGAEHPLRTYLIECGLSAHELAWFEENPCPPDVIGINHYPTSDRFLDENCHLYPDVIPADNGRHVHSDVEAVRAMPDRTVGFRDRLIEAWNRYQLPLAITESHLGCSREEQIRWFAESWESAESARRDGADVRAVTAWSLLGAYNWNTLVTHDANFYEPGVFDIRGGKPRPTALAGLLRSFGEGEMPDHPALFDPGWWRRPERLFSDRRPEKMVVARVQHKNPKPCLLVLGATGTLGRAFVRACDVRGLHHRSFTRRDLDLADAAAVEHKIREIQPWAVINATGYVRVDDAEGDPKGCFEVNTEGAVRLATACRRAGSSLLCFSSDLVFDGLRKSCYMESDTCSPLNIYGHSKAAMEKRVLSAMPDALVVRTSSFFGPTDDWNLVTRALRDLARGETVWLPDDVVFSPTYVPDLVIAAFDLLIDGAAGIWHLANSGEVTWADLAWQAAKKRGIDARSLRRCSQRDLNQCAIRPGYSALGTSKGQILPDFQDALYRYAAEVRI